jgi:hypothetical protein
MTLRGTGFWSITISLLVSYFSIVGIVAICQIAIVLSQARPPSCLPLCQRRLQPSRATVEVIVPVEKCLVLQRAAMPIPLLGRIDRLASGMLERRGGGRLGVS